MLMKPAVRALLLVSVIIAVVLAFRLMISGPPDTAARATPASTTAGSASVSPGAMPEQTAPSVLVAQSEEGVVVPDHLPPSLLGTSVPSGWARVDRLGNLIPTAELRQMFEYFLSALGEESLPQLVRRIRTSLAALEQPARDQALATLGAYLDYKLAVSDLESAYNNAGPLTASEMQRRMEEIHALRRTWLDAETADAFFATDEAVDRFQLEKRRIANAGMTPEARAAALEAAEAALPEPIRQARQETRRFAEYARVREQLAGDPEALQAWRRQAFGADNAARLADLEAQQRAWDRRWQAYSHERDALLSSGLAGPDLDAAMERLRARHFSETEQIRARALDSIR